MVEPGAHFRAHPVVGVCCFRRVFIGVITQGCRCDDDAMGGFQHRLGEGLKEAEIVEWFAEEGDRVVADQPLLSVETDKAVVEVPSPWTGVITKRRASVGEVLNIGAPLLDIDDGGKETTDKGAIVGELQPTDKKSLVEEQKTEPVGRAAPAGAGAATEGTAAAAIEQ